MTQAISRKHSLSIAIGLTLILAIGGTSSAQTTQTLPRNFDSGAGGSGSGFPFNATTDHIWQWHYDSGQFNAIGPILISEVYVRVLNNLQANPFNFTSVELVMASSPTDYTVAGTATQPGHATLFSANLNPDATVVRPGTPWVGAPAAATWIPMGMVVPFAYDPSLGNDFVLQIRKCGTVSTWGQSIFGSSGSAGLNGGNRYGDQSSCMALSHTFSNNEFVPIIRIDYSENNNLSLSQTGPGVGDLLVSLTMLSPTAHEGWTLISGNIVLPAGQGPVFGLNPDILTWSIFSFPYFPGNPFHFRTADAGVFPSTPFFAPPGSVSSLLGQTFDFGVFMLDTTGTFDSKSNVVRFMFQ